MKRILIHVGYPKAASTSLQNGLFLELHKKKVINFLGRAFESAYFGTKKNRREFKGWFTSVIGGNDSGQNADSIGNLSDSVLNVLSEGLFMMNERHHDGIVTPRHLRNHFSSVADKIEILLVVRNQMTLIPSYYIQNYRKLKQSKFRDYVAYNVRHQWTGEAKIFDFHAVARTYADVFGRDNVHLLLFEDFVQNRERFSFELGRIMGLPANLVKENLGDSHLNQTKKEEGVMVIRKLDKNSLRHKLIQLLQRLHLDNGRRLRVRLPSVSDAEKQIIFDSFKASNLKLAEEFSLNKQAMQAHGYF